MSYPLSPRWLCQTSLMGYVLPLKPEVVTSAKHHLWGMTYPFLMFLLSLHYRFIANVLSPDALPFDNPPLLSGLDTGCPMACLHTPQAELIHALFMTKLKDCRFITLIVTMPLSSGLLRTLAPYKFLHCIVSHVLFYFRITFPSRKKRTQGKGELSSGASEKALWVEPHMILNRGPYDYNKPKR